MWLIRLSQRATGHLLSQIRIGGIGHDEQEGTLRSVVDRATALLSPVVQLHWMPCLHHAGCLSCGSYCRSWSHSEQTLVSVDEPSDDMDAARDG